MRLNAVKPEQHAILFLGLSYPTYPPIAIRANNSRLRRRFQDHYVAERERGQMFSVLLILNALSHTNYNEKRKKAIQYLEETCKKGPINCLGGEGKGENSFGRRLNPITCLRER
uniref:Uncharacterized protein n=1 Tax=Caenorhabditis japonica TaxID=281687 RepID=A0A8R1IDP8_CAEJA